MGIRERGRLHMTFTVGETVVYPHHGAALIEEIKTRTIRGESKLYLKRSEEHTSELQSR